MSQLEGTKVAVQCKGGLPIWLACMLHAYTACFGTAVHVDMYNVAGCWLHAACICRPRISNTMCQRLTDMKLIFKSACLT